MNDKKIVYFVRHGQSKDNASPVFQSTESPLSELGISQVNKIAQRVSSLMFESLISSPLPRASQTAEIIAEKTGKKPEYSELFVERIKPSDINGKPYTDDRASRKWREWEKSLYTSSIKIGDGENYDEITKRAAQALDWLENRPEASLVVVTHGYFLRVIIAKVLLGEHLTPETSKSFQKIAWMENTGISAIRLSKGFEDDYMWRLWTYNDIAHLAE